MKKQGIINQPLMYQIAGLGHGDEFVVCDCGFPIPAGVPRVDLALVKGTPTTFDVVQAILSEVIVERVVLAGECQEYSIDFYRRVQQCFANQSKEEPPMEAFVERAAKAKFVVRTGDITPYANILLRAASGVEKYYRGLEITPAL